MDREQQQRQQRRRRRREGCSFCWPLAAAVLLLAHPAAARIEIITDNPSPFAAVDPNAPKFVVALYDDAAKAPLVPPSGEAVPRFEVMAGADGRQYNCTLPTSKSGIGSSSGGSSSASTGTTVGSGSSTDSGSGTVSGISTGSGSGGGNAKELARAQDAPLPPSTKSPFELLEPLTALCLYHKDATWTYEVCHRSRVLQFRKDGSKRKEEFSCGAYNGDDAQDGKIMEDTSASGHPVRYAVHTYANGADCHLTGRPRTAEVRYTCLRGARENLVASVREFPTCNYVVVVSTPLLCGHPAFKPPPEDVRVINCTPLDGGSSGSGGGASSGGEGAAASKEGSSGEGAAAGKEGGSVGSAEGSGGKDEL